MVFVTNQRLVKFASQVREKTIGKKKDEYCSPSKIPVNKDPLFTVGQPVNSVPEENESDMQHSTNSSLFSLNLDVQ